MIVDRIENWKNYRWPGNKFKKAFGMLERKAFNARTKDVYASTSSYKTCNRKKKLFEAHRSYIDIHAVISGEEIIEWCPVEGLKVKSGYNKGKDVVFYKLADKSSLLKMRPGMFAVFFLEDAHMPGCQSGKLAKVTKVVVKVRG